MGKSNLLEFISEEAVARDFAVYQADGYSSHQNASFHMFRLLFGQNIMREVKSEKDVVPFVSNGIFLIIFLDSRPKPSMANSTT